jgi:gliding motility-associated-like protein
MKGGEVPLQASGAQRYTWSPATGLNDVGIPNQLLPLRLIAIHGHRIRLTRLYERGYSDHYGGANRICANLFSPNDDGQNDQLKIYGVASAQRFTFSIYDREGALVYKTSDVSEAVQQGWDGTKNGTKQPPGVYFWKVKGEVASGQLLLNGKDSGSIVLIR